MYAKLLTHHQEWEQFVRQQAYTFFVQSCHYGEFYKQRGEDFFVLGVYEEGGSRLIGGTLVVTTHAKRGNFLYLPYGPIISPDPEQTARYPDVLQAITDFLEVFGHTHHYDFLRISPFLADTPENKNLFAKLGFRPAPMHVLAETTWILDISEAEETLFKNMKKNHRNLIRRCEKEGVRIEKTTNKESLQGLHKLLDITAKRHQFSRFSPSYIESEFTAFAKHEQAILFNAYLPDGTLDASAIFMYYGTMGVYRHSASLGKDSRLPTSYLLQWEAIKEGQKRGMHYHNFWGIAPDESKPDHPFYGITHFKKGFGGFKKDILHCQDLPLGPKYWLNWSIESLRRLKRGF